MALSVTITGGEAIEQGQQIPLAVTVTDADGNTPPGTLQYAWSASRGSFVGATDAATAVYHADFTDANAVDVTITCDVTRPANTTPTSSGPSLTALAEIGVTGILVNMFLTALGAVAANTNSVLYNNSTGTLDAGSDQRLSSNINVYQLRWDNTNNNFVLNNNEAGNIGTFFTGNNNQSVYIIFADGTYVELTPADFAAGTSRGQTWARWLVTDANILSLLNALSTTDDLVVGVADAGAIGWDADSGSDTETFSAAVPLPLSIEAIDEQFIALNTEDYDLVIDITGRPDTVEAKGHMEGFIQDWDAVNGQLHIKSDKVTRLISGVDWDIDIRKGMQALMGQVAYNVIQAAPIFETLQTIHLYRGVPINFDIVIQNIPPLLIPNARLLGLKSELVEYGVNVKGSIGATDNLSINTGNVRIVVPSETGGADTVYEFPYEIEAGSPPAIGTPEFTPKGNYGSLEVADVTHAFGYEWTLETGDEATWNFFSNSRNVIDPATVEVTPGNLNVTLKFPNIAGASSYEYMLESERTSSSWIRFTGTLSNNMITTIIPDLEDGVEYTLRLRVASPWIGTPISVKVYGGRFVYCIHDASTGDDVLYLFHTGVANGGTATRIKRVLLPTTLTTTGGLAVDADRNVYILNMVDRASGEKALYVFNASVIDAASDGDRIAPSKKNPLPNDVGPNADGRGLAIYNNELYILLHQTATGTGVFRNGRTIASLSAADGQTLTGSRHTVLDVGGRTSRNEYLDGLSVTANLMFVMSHRHPSAARIDAYERDSGLATTSMFQNYILSDEDNDVIPRANVTGLKVIDDAFYVINGLELIRTKFNNANRYQQEWFMNLPLGLTNPRWLDMLT